MMTEWTVVCVVIALVGLIVTLCKPIITLTKSITQLTVMVQDINQTLIELTAKNTRSHDRLWEHSDEQDKRLDDHETRISRMEGSHDGR